MDERQGVDAEHADSHDGVMLSAPRPHDPPAPVTWRDFVALPDDDRRELIDGALVEVEVPTFLHEWIVSRLLIALDAWLTQRGGFALGSGYKVRISQVQAFMPDVQIFRRTPARFPGRFDQGLSEGAPDLVVEVISPGSGRHDRVTKFNGYAAIGCPEYWLVDPDSRLVEQFVLEGGHYRLGARLADDAIFAPETLPGLTIALGPLWSPPGVAADPAEAPESNA